MATRNILHRNKLDSFKTYLKANGWLLQDTKGMYEVLIRRNELAQERFKDLEEYFGSSKSILEDREEFKKWLDFAHCHL